MGVDTEGTLPKPDFSLRTVGAMNVVTVAKWILQLLNDHAYRYSLRPTAIVPNTNVSDVGSRILVSRSLVDASDSFA